MCFYTEDPTNNPELFLEAVHRISLCERVDSPSVSSQQSEDIFLVGVLCLW